MSPRGPLVLAVAPTGARRSKADHPALPVEPAELARTAAACREAGACLFHLHVRDRSGGHSLDVAAYREATAAIRGAVGDGLIIQVTTEAVGRYRPEQQMAMVRELRPEAVSLSIGELIPSAAAESEAAAFLAWLDAESIVPQYILYSPAELVRLRDLCRRGIVPHDRPFVLFVLGRYTADPVQPRALLGFLEPFPEDLEWAVCAFGEAEAASVMLAASLGGHVRVGFENNLRLADGRPASDNAALVGQAAAGAAAIGRPLADAAAARRLLQSPDRSKTAGTTASLPASHDDPPGSISLGGTA